MKTETYNEMDYFELDELVNSYFPKSKFNFVADEEMNNDTEKTFGRINKFDWDNLSDIYKKEFEGMISGILSTTYRTHLFLKYFVHYEILPEGRYLINVSW